MGNAEVENRAARRRQVTDYELALLARVLAVEPADFFAHIPPSSPLHLAATIKKARRGRQPET